MKCNEIKDLLSLYIDKMLDERQEKDVEEHLSACDSCRAEYDEMKEILDLLGQTGMVPVPDAFSFRLKKALKEEKQNMIDSGIINKPSKKKNQWRIITSVAAVFAVGVLSFGLYHDVLGILPDQMSGGEQAGNAQTEAVYDAAADKTKSADDSAGKLNISSDGSVVMKDQSSDLQPMAKQTETAANEKQSNNTNSQMKMASSEEENAASSSDHTQDTTYGVAGGANPSIGDESAAADTVTDPESVNRSEGFDQNVTKNSAIAPAPEECSRSLTAAGVERNAAAVQFYNNLIEEKLKGFDYQVLSSSYAQTGEWQFRIFIFRGKDGNTYNEEITVIGKEGEIEVICSNEFMGL